MTVKELMERIIESDGNATMETRICLDDGTPIDSADFMWDDESDSMWMYLFPGKKDELEECDHD